MRMGRTGSCRRPWSPAAISPCAPRWTGWGRDRAAQGIPVDRMDGVKLGREEFARGKAFAAVFYRRSTRESAKLQQTSPDQFHGALAMFPGRFFIVPGGFPIMAGRE